MAKACNPDFDGLCSTELLVLQASDIDRRALLYSLLSDGFIKLVDSATYGSKMPRASWDFVGNCVLPIAPSNEQRAIADFLDRETAKINMLVAKKRTLIERLQEKRTALISRTVTRSLPPLTQQTSGSATLWPRTCWQGLRRCETVLLNQSDWQYRSAMLIGSSRATSGSNTSLTAGQGYQAQVQALNREPPRATGRLHRSGRIRTSRQSHLENGPLYMSGCVVHVGFAP